MAPKQPALHCVGGRVKRLYLNSALSLLLGKKGHVYFEVNAEGSIVLSEALLSEGKKVYLFDVKNETVSYSAELAKALAMLPGCPKSEYTLVGFEKQNDLVILNVKNARFVKEVMGHDGLEQSRSSKEETQKA